MEGNIDEKKGERLWSLFLTFLKAGVLTFLGEHRMYEAIHHEMVEERHWLTAQEILDVFEVSESVPGPIAVNKAAFIGYKIGKTHGAAVASLGIALPAVLLIAVVLVALDAIRGAGIAEAAFRGMRIGVTVLIFSGLRKLLKPIKRSTFNLSLIFTALFLSLFFRINAVVILLVAILLGIIYSIWLVKNKGGKS